MDTPRPELMHAMMMQESQGNPNAVSPKGARGLYQIMPDTARDPGIKGVSPMKNWSEPEQHRFAGEYLGALIKKHGSETLGLAAYNGGTGNVDKYHGIPPFKETQKYVKNILKNAGGDQGAMPPRYFTRGEIQTNNQSILSKQKQDAIDGAVDAPSWHETFKSMEQQGHLLSASQTALETALTDPDPNFKPKTQADVEKLLQEHGLSRDFTPRLMESVSGRHESLILKNIKDDLANQETIHRSGWANILTAGVASDFTDPLNAVLNLGTLGVGTGAKLGRLGYIAAQAGVQGGLQVGQEAALYGMHEDRPAEQMLIAGAAGTILGGGVGAMSHEALHSLKMDHVLAKQYEQAIEAGQPEIAKVILNNISPSNRQGLVDAGAAANKSLKHDTAEVEAQIEQRLRFAEGGVGDQEIINHNNPGNSLDTGIANIDKSIGGYLSASQSPTARKLGMLVDNGVGVNKAGESLGHSAETYKRVLDNTTKFEVLTAAQDAFREFRQANPKVKRADFMKEVTRAVETGSHSDPSVTKAASAASKYFKKYEQEALDSGLLEKDHVNKGNYVPHLLDLENIRKLNKEVGQPQIEEMLQGSLHSHSIKSGNYDERILGHEANIKYADDILRDLEKTAKAEKNPLKYRRQIEEAKRELAKAKKGLKDFPKTHERFTKALAKGYARSILLRGEIGSHGTIARGVPLDDRLQLKAILKDDAGLSESEVDDIIHQMTLQPTKNGSGRTKARVQFDMDFQHNGLAMTNLFHQNMDHILAQYGHQMSGRIAAAKILGITSDSQFESMLKEMAVELAGKDMHSKIGSHENVAKMAYKGLMGQPLIENPSSGAVKAGRILKDLNYMAIGSSFTFAQVAELGNVLGGIGFKAALQQMPALREIMAMIKGGTMPDGLHQSLQAMMAVGTNALRNKVFTGIAEDGSMIGGIEKATHAGKNMVANYSLFNHVMRLQQHMAAAGYAQRLVNVAREVNGDISKIPSGQLRELKSIGIQTDKELKDLFSHLTDPTKTTLGTHGNLHDFNTSNWNPKVMNDFSMMLDTMTNRLVQENSLGTSFTFMHSSILMQLLLQFKSFAFNAIAKQTLQGMSQRDMTVGLKFGMSVIFGTTGYALQQYVMNRNRPDYKERMSDKGLVTGGISRIGMMSMLPTLADMAIVGTSLGTVKPLFTHGRSSGLSTFGVPAFAVGGAALHDLVLPANLLRDDFKFSQGNAKDLIRVLPMGNHPAWAAWVDAASQRLPKKSTDKQTDVLDFIGFSK